MEVNEMSKKARNKVCLLCGKPLRGKQRKYCKGHSQSEIDAHIKQLSYNEAKNKVDLYNENINNFLNKVNIENEYDELYSVEHEYIPHNTSTRYTIIGEGGRSVRPTLELGTSDLLFKKDNGYSEIFTTSNWDNPDYWTNSAIKLQKHIDNLHRVHGKAPIFKPTAKKNLKSIKLDVWEPSLHYTVKRTANGLEQKGKWWYEYNNGHLGIGKLWLFNFEAEKVIDGDVEFISALIKKPVKSEPLFFI